MKQRPPFRPEELFNMALDQRARAEKAETNLRRAVEIAEEMAMDNWPSEHPLYAELDAIKATLLTQQPNSPTA